MTVACTAACGAEPPSGNEQASGENDARKAIRQSAEEFARAFGQQDAKAVADLWTPEGIFVDAGGEEHAGRESIQQVYQEFFDGQADVAIQIDIESIRMVAPNVAVEHGRSSLVPPPPGTPSESEYLAVHVKQDDGGWLLDSVREWGGQAATTDGQISHLEHLAGEWVAEQGETKIRVSGNWNSSKSYLERTFTVTSEGQQSSSTETIGWDPLAGQVTSWTFADDGSRNVGRWTALEDGWIVENRGVTGDGVRTSSIDFWAPLLDRALGWRSTQRSANGLPLRAPGEVVLKQQPASR